MVVTTPEVARVQSRSRRNTANFATYTLVTSGMCWSARADFSGNYALTPPIPGSYDPQVTTSFGLWTANYVNDPLPDTTPSIDTSAAPAGVALGLSSRAIVSFASNQDVLTLLFTATAAETVQFDYSFSTDTGSFKSDAAFLLNAVPTALSGSGTLVQALNIGDQFGFRLRDGSAYFGFPGVASLTISNFQVVPESTSLGALASGFAGLMGWREIRRRRAAARTRN